MKAYRFSAVVKDATVENVLPPARGLLLGRGAAMLTKSTETCVKNYKFSSKSFLINVIDRCGVWCGKLSRSGSQSKLAFEQQYVIHTIFSALILIHNRKDTYSSCTCCLERTKSIKDILIYRPQGISPIQGRSRGYPVPQNSCRPTHPLDLLLRGVERGGCSISQKIEHRPPLRNRTPWSPFGRGVGVPPPPQVTRVTKFFICTCIFLQHYRIHMDIGNSKNYFGIMYAH